MNSNDSVHTFMRGMSSEVQLIDLNVSLCFRIHEINLRIPFYQFCIKYISTGVL